MGRSSSGGGGRRSSTGSEPGGRISIGGVPLGPGVDPVAIFGSPVAGGLVRVSALGWGVPEDSRVVAGCRHAAAACACVSEVVLACTTIAVVHSRAWSRIRCALGRLQTGRHHLLTRMCSCRSKCTKTNVYAPADRYAHTYVRRQKQVHKHKRVRTYRQTRTHAHTLLHLQTIKASIHMCTVRAHWSAHAQAQMRMRKSTGRTTALSHT
jgi:hypothetical protein